jgi:predicted nucleic acid binding AN1-type Zn finger protein
MKCQCCKKKLAMINCKGCNSIFCSGCIQMELHSCTGLAAAKIEELRLLKERLVKIESKKLLGF